MKVEARRNSVCKQYATGCGEDVCGTAMDGYRTERRILDVFAGEVVNAADFGGATAPTATAQPDPSERATGRRWLAVVATALVGGRLPRR